MVVVGQVHRGSFDSFRRKLHEPWEIGGNGKTEKEKEDKKSKRPNWNPKKRKSLGDTLGEGPPAYDVSGSNLVNITPLQLAEETIGIHLVMDICHASLF